MADVTTVKEITAKLEQGVKDLFESDKYAAYLQTMSRFHNYSTRNTLLIHMQLPTATKCAGYGSWKNNFKRQVKKGEHGIRIFAPMPFVVKEELAKLDPVTKQPIIGENGQPVMEEYIKAQSARFKIVTIFDISQTDGEPLPELAETLTGSVERYELFVEALRAVSPLPIVFEPLTDQDGYCRFGDRIGIREGMSEVQTVSAIIHEITHAKLHDRDSLAVDEELPDTRTAEVTAESVSFVVNNHFSIDTGANSWGYIAEWSRSKELKELNASLDVIRKTSAELIEAIDKQYRALAKERGIDLSVVADELGEEQNYNMIDGVINNAPPKQEPQTEPPHEQQSEPEHTDNSAILDNYAHHAEVRDTRQIGETILMTLLFEDGNLNRDGKRSRVKVEPPIGKYEMFSRDEGTPPHQTNYLYTMTACGKLAMLGESERLSDLTETRLDEYILSLVPAFEKQLAAPTEWADFTAAAFLNRIDEAEAHNVPVRELREAERQAEREARLEREKQLVAEKREIFDARVDEIAKAIETGANVNVSYGVSDYDGKNPVLELFKLYGVALPLKTQGWVNKRLAAINGDSYSYYKGNGGKPSSAFMDALQRLIRVVKLTPIEQKRGGIAVKPAKTEVKRTLEHELYEKFAALFPDFADRKYSYMRLESKGFEPLSLEFVFGDHVSVMHTYELNGDLCYDPMIEFHYNSTDRTMNAVMFQQSIPPLYQYYDEDGVGRSVDGNGNQREAPNLSARLNEFSSQWFDNISEQDFMPVKATLWNEGRIDDVDVRIEFDKDGKPIMPETEASEPELPQTPIITLPDANVTLEDMAAFGYTDTVAMYPLSIERAIELFESGNPVYLLYPDNTEAMPWDASEIKVHDGLCGIEVNDWERIQSAEKPIVTENAREAELLHGDKNLFGIYQIRDDINAPRDFRFANMRELEAHGLTVDRANYELVYTGELPIHDRQTNLHRLFDVFQHDSPECPQDFAARSMSVSDVIVLQWRGEVSSHFVDSIGFKELPSFTGNEREQTQAAENTNFSQVGKSSDAPTVADLDAEVKAGKSISLSDLSKAVNNERNQTFSKAKPSLHDRLAAGKQRAAQQGKTPTAPSIDTQKTNNHREV